MNDLLTREGRLGAMRARLAALRGGGVEPHSIHAAPVAHRTWARTKAENEGLRVLDERGTKALPTWPPLSDDIHSALVQMTPRLRPEEETPPAFRANHRLVSEVLEHPEYERLHARTFSNEAYSAIAAVNIEDTLIRQLEESEKRTGGAAAASARAAQEAQEAQGAAQRACAIAQISLDAQAPEEDIDALLARAEAALDQAERHEQESEEALDKASADAGEHGQKNTQDLAQAMAQALDEAKDAERAVRAWGNERGAQRQVSAAEAMQMAQMLRQNPTLRKITDLMGRMKVARRERGDRPRLTRTGDIRVGVSTGRDLGRMVASERAKYGINPDLWLWRYAESKIVQYETAELEIPRLGPIVMIIDRSGSMSGMNEIWAKATAITVSDHALAEDRPVYIAFFDTEVESAYVFDFRSGADYTTQRRLQVAEVGAGGGTDISFALAYGLSTIKKHRYLEAADLLLVTDGDYGFNAATQKALQEQIAEMRIKVHSIIVPGGRKSTTVPFGKTTLLTNVMRDGVDLTMDLLDDFDNDYAEDDR